MIRLFDFPLSGNAHKVRNMLSLLGLEHELVHVDLLAGAQRSPEFLELNPFAQVPVLVDDSVVLRDSSAILVYLGRKYGRGQWLPVDAEGEARVQEWLSIATREIAEGPGLARLVSVFGVKADQQAARERAHQLFRQFEAQLGERQFLTGDRPTIADIANHSYIALAPDGGVELDDYPNLRAWIARLEQLPGFVQVPARPVQEAA